MSDEIVELESALVSEPFNAELRLRYADLLLEVHRTDDARVQYELLLSQADQAKHAIR